MLPSAQRLTSSGDYSVVVRRGRRAGNRTLVVHALSAAPTEAGDASPRVGFVVNRAVGNAVARNRVKRRLRALLGARLGARPAGERLVVRALPTSAGTTFDQLGDALDRCLAKLDHATDRGRSGPGVGLRTPGVGGR